MAASQYASTAETTNANRVNRVLLDPCSDQLRDLLRHHVPPQNFPQVIKSRRFSLPRLHTDQINLVRPKTGQYSGNYSDFDISLLYLLLRNICNIPPHNKGWGNDPDSNDKSLSANIERIRNVRNRVVGHLNRSSLSNSDFNDIWSTIRAVVVDIDTYLNNNKKYQNIMDFLKIETMDPEIAKQYEERLRKQIKEDEETRKMITETKQCLEDQKRELEQLRTNIKRDREEDKEQITAKLAKIEGDQEILYSRQQHDHQKLTSEKAPEINRFKEKLVEINDMESEEVPLSQVLAGGHKLPIEQLFSSVVIKEDIRKTSKGINPAKEGKQQERKEVKSPKDLFTKNGKKVPRVFMLGKPAYGKTTYCMWLLKTWCTSQHSDLKDTELTEWEDAMSQFDFVFYVPLRRVDSSRFNVTDMICDDVLGSDAAFKEVAKHVLSNDRYRCFIMIDGLDEWKPNESARDRLKYKGMPNIDNMSNCVVFTTMRHWKFAEVEGTVRSNDQLVEILGLDDKGIAEVIEKVLVYYYKMIPNTPEYERKHKEITSQLENETVKSFMKIPLLAVVSVQIWYQGEQVGETMTSFYIALINMWIERANLKYETQTLQFELFNVNLPRLSAKKNIKRYFNVLFKLGKVAYEGLLPNRMKLVFQKDDFEAEIGEKELQFALDVGLIGEREVHSLMEKRISVHFFHKSVQEFLAAVYIVTQENVKHKFCDSLSDIWAIKELSNVIMFVCGICPSWGTVLSNHVVSITDGNTEILQYRKSPSLNNTVKNLYSLQLKWYREFKYGQRDILSTFYISDIFLGGTDKGRTKMTEEVLSNHHVEPKSLYLQFVLPDEKNGISNEKLHDILCNDQNTRSLVMIYIAGKNHDRSIDTICGPALRYLDLRNITIQDNDIVRHPLISNMDKLQILVLWDLTLGDRDLGLTEQMTQLQDVEFWFVNLTASGWRRFIQSVVDIHHQFDVTLRKTNIDNESISTIRSSRHLSVTLEKDGDGWSHLEFTRKWPLTWDTN